MLDMACIVQAVVNRANAEDSDLDEINVGYILCGVGKAMINQAYVEYVEDPDGGSKEPVPTEEKNNIINIQGKKSA